MRLRSLWRVLLQFGLFLAFLAAIGLGGGLALGGLLLSLGRAATIMLIYAAALAAMVASLAVAARWLDRRPLSDFGLRLDRAWWLDLGYGLALGALLMTGIFLVERWLGWLTVSGVLVQADPGQPFVVEMLAPLGMFVCVGIYEELLSRGYHLSNFAQGMNTPWLGERNALLLALLLSSAIFGLGHAANPDASPISTINITLAGVMLGLSYVLTGRLGLAIGLHITWNFFQGNVYGLPVSGNPRGGPTVFAVVQGGPELWTGGSFGPEAGLLGVAAMVAGCLLIVAWVRLRTGRLALATEIARPPAPRESS